MDERRQRRRYVPTARPAIESDRILVDLRHLCRKWSRRHGGESRELRPPAFGLLGLFLLGGLGRGIDNLQSRIQSLSRFEAKLDLLLAQAAVKFDAYAN